MEPTLYIFMRNDIPELNPGKCAAQAAHAQADFDYYIKTNTKDDYKLDTAHLMWIHDRNFGRTLVLEVNLSELELINELFIYSGQTIDPTYPWRNFYGELKLSNIVTCGWAFVYEDSDNQTSLDVLTKLPLYR